jgi:pimeloyl-ACP methyl ester carboxylesterase
MLLNYKQLGQGQALIIHHGLFGSLDNWMTLARRFAAHFNVYLIDARNHGQSPHSEQWDYPTMAQDLYEFIQQHNILYPIIMGHSMGGKVAMHFASEHPEMLDKLIVVDIAPKDYPPHHQEILKALNAVDFSKIKSRREADETVSIYIKDVSVKQFLLKNMYWKNPEELAWRFNLPVIEKNIDLISKNTIGNTTINVPTLFIAGAKSNYILPSDEELIKAFFPQSEILFFPNAGHWVHVEAPNELFEAVLKFSAQ